MYVFAAGEFSSRALSIGILHFRNHWTGIIASPPSSLSTFAFGFFGSGSWRLSFSHWKALKIKDFFINWIFYRF